MTEPKLSYECDNEQETDSATAYETLDSAVEKYLYCTRKIVMTGEIDDVMAAGVCNALQYYNCKSKIRPVFMYINSPGGSMSAGFSIIDQMECIDCPVCTIVRGEALSMAALITAFGTPGLRFAMPSASLMIHSVSLIESGNSAECIEKHMLMVRYLETEYRTKVKELAKRLSKALAQKINPKELEKMMAENLWMNPKKAISIGLIDGIWTKEFDGATNL